MKQTEKLAIDEHEAVLAEVNRCNDGLEKGKNELIALLQERRYTVETAALCHYA